MTEKIFVISDIEMGRGDIMDDFSDDQAVCDFTAKISTENPEAAITLVLNGDIFDFMKMAYQGEYPRYVTAEISLWKLNEVVKTHPLIFDAWKNFVSAGNNIFFVIGNHDADLAWPALQEKIRGLLGGNETNVQFGFSYSHKDIHAEHGHMHEPFFSIDPLKSIIKYKGEEILNLPWGAQACFHYLVHLKKKFPVEERMFPKPMALQKNSQFKKESRKTIYKLALKEILLNPLLKFYDPTYRAPLRKFIGHVLQHGLNIVDDQKFVPTLLRRASRKNPGKKIIVLGHAHVLTDTASRTHRHIITDTWRNELDLTNNMAKKKKSYAEITYYGDHLQGAELKTFQP